jgi:Cullin family
MEDFIEFKKKSDDLVQRVFNDPKNRIVGKAFENFLNIDPNIVAEYLAKFLDFHLKKQSQDDYELGLIVKEVLGLFKLCNAKDIFEEFYSRGLSRRLLLKKVSSYESERQMITRLRAECSADFSNKCEAMMKDLSESENFMEDYRKIVPDH